MIHEPSETIKAISSIVIAAGAIQGVFMSLVFFGRSRQRLGSARRPEALLALLMLTFAANIVHASVIRTNSLSSGLCHTAFEPLQLLFGPLVYQYVKSLVHPDSGSFRRAWAIRQLAAFAFIVAIFIVPGYFSAFGPTARKILDAAAWAFTLAYLLFYLRLTVAMVHAHQKKVRDEFARVDDVDLGWIRVFVVVFLIMEFLWALLLVWVIHAEPSVHFSKVAALVSSLVVYSLGFRGLLQKPAVRLGAEPPSPLASPRYARSGLGEEDLRRLRSDLLHIMEAKSPWLDPDLNLQDLSQIAGIPRHNLTEVINLACGKNFCDFVNEYRVDEFKRLLVSPGAAQFTILGLAFDSGFNSKATFNAAFKNATGITPSAWRNSLNLV